MLPQDLGQRLHVLPKPSLVPQGHDLGAEGVQAGQHGRIGAGCGYVSAVGLLEQRAALGEPVDVGRGLAMVAVTAHVVGQQGIHAQQYDIRMLLPAPVGFRHGMALVGFYASIQRIRCIPIVVSNVGGEE